MIPCRKCGKTRAASPPCRINYDAYGRITTDTIPAGTYSAFTDDDEGEPTGYSAFGGVAATIAYTNRGELTKEAFSNFVGGCAGTQNQGYAGMQQMRVLVGALDVAPATPMPTPAAQDAIRVNFANPRTLARALEREVPHLRASVLGGTVILTGTPEDIQQGTALAQRIDAPPLGARYTQVYRLQRVGATSVGDLVARSYPQAHVTVDKALNAISVLGTAAEQTRIAAAIAQLDGATSGTPGDAGAAYGAGNIAVVDLNSAMPGQNGSPSTTAQDIASAVQQALQALAPDLRVTVPANSAQIVLAGSPPSIRLAQSLIARLDRPQPLVVLDTEVLEVDENAAPAGDELGKFRFPLEGEPQCLAAESLPVYEQLDGGIKLSSHVSCPFGHDTQTVGESIHPPRPAYFPDSTRTRRSRFKVPGTSLSTTTCVPLVRSSAPRPCKPASYA